MGHPAPLGFIFFFVATVELEDDQLRSSHIVVIIWWGRGSKSLGGDHSGLWD